MRENNSIRMNWFKTGTLGALVAGVGAMAAVDLIGPGSISTQAHAERLMMVEEPEEVVKTRVTLNRESDNTVEEQIRAALKLFERENFRDGLPVLQGIINTMGNNVHVTDDPSERYYRSKVSYIEDVIKKSGPRGLETYQLLYDGVARGFMNTADQKRDIGSLGKVVQRYFLTNYGDDAAFILGGLLLDRGDVSGAIRILQKGLTHPNPSIDQNEVKLRLAIALGRFGDPERAEEVLAEVTTSEFKRQLVQELLANGPVKQAENRAGEWIMAMGDSQRDGRMKSLEGIAKNSKDIWPTIWEFNGLDSARQPMEKMYVPTAVNMGFQEHFRNNRPITRNDIYKRWVSNGWFPANRAAMVGNHMIFLEYNKIVCLDMMSGKVVWHRDFSMPRTHASRPSYGYHRQQNSNVPSSFQERLMFNNELSRQVVVIRDHVFYLDGQDRHVGFDQVFNNAQQEMGHVSLMVVSMAKQGAMVRYFNSSVEKNDIRRDGKWVKVDNPFYGARFVSLPVYTQGQMVIAALENNTALYLYGIDYDEFIENGDPEKFLKWKQFVCDDPQQNGVRATPVGLTVHNQTLYVSSGMTVVASYDVLNGSLNWLSLYEPVGITRTRRNMRSYPLQEQTWWSNRVLVVGNQVVVAAVDSNKLMSFNAGDGKALWSVNKNGMPRDTAINSRSVNPIELVGADNGYVIAAGRDGIKYFDTMPVKHEMEKAKRWGRAPKPKEKLSHIDWQRPLADGRRMTGRPAMTEEFMLIPVMDENDQAVVIKMHTRHRGYYAAPRAKLSDSAPLGNLYTNGRFLISVGPDRVMGLAELSQQIRISEEELRRDPNNPSKLATHAGMLAKDLQNMKAIEYYRKAEELTESKTDRKVLAGKIFELILDETDKLIEKQPQKAAELLELAKNYHQTKAQAANLSLTRSQVLARMGEYAKAAELLVEMMEGSKDLTLTTGYKDTLKLRADQKALYRFREMLKTYGEDPELVTWIETEVQNRVSLLEALKTDSASSMEQVLQQVAFIRSVAGQREAGPLLNAVSHWLYEQNRWEQAEILLREGIRQKEADWQALSLAIYATLSEKQGLKLDAERYWRTVSEAHPEAMIILKDQAIQAKLLSDQALIALALPQGAAEQLRLGPDDQEMKHAWQDKEPIYYPLRLKARRQSEFLMKHVVMFGHDRRKPSLRLFELETGKERFNQTFPQLSSPLGVNPYTNYRGVGRYFGDTLIPGGVDRHMVILRHNEEISAIGMVSGRKLWHNKTVSKQAQRVAMSNRMLNIMRGRGLQMDIAEGYLAMMNKGMEGNVEAQVYDLMTGEKKWTFLIPDQKSQGLRIHDDLLIVHHSSQKAAWIIDLRNGKLVNGKLTQFKDLEAGKQVAHPLFHEGGMLYQSRNDGLIYMDLRTGKHRWRIQNGGAYTRKTGLVNDEILWVNDARGDLAVYEMRTGKILYRAPTVQDVQDAALTPDGKMLYAIGIKEIRSGPQLSILDHKTGKLAVKQIDLFRQATGDLYNTTSAWDMANARRYVPWAVSKTPSKLNSIQKIHFYDVTTGKEAKVSLPGTREGGRFPHLSQQIMVQNDRIILGLQVNGVVVFEPLKPREETDVSQARPQAPEKPDAAIDHVDAETGK